MDSRVIGFKAVDIEERCSDPTYGIVICSFCGIGVIINGVMIIVLLIENKWKNSYNVTYLNLSGSDFLWALFGACIDGPGTASFTI